MIYKNIKYLNLSILFLICLSCKKEPPIEGNTLLKIYDAYNPEGHGMNDNGFYFIDKNYDNSIDSNSFTTIFGFDHDCNKKFIKSYLTEDLIINTSGFNNISVNKFLVNEELVIAGNAYKNDTVYGFMTKFDPSNGSIINYNVFKFGKIDDVFKTTPLEILKTSYGYLLFHINYFLSNNNGFLEIKKTDENLNLIENKLIPLPNSLGLLSAPIYQDNINGYSYDYNGAIITPDDELIISYMGAEVTFQPSSYIVKYNSNLDFIWANKFMFDLNQYYAIENKSEIFWFNDKILLFTKDNFSPNNVLSDYHSTSPCLFSLDPNSGSIDSKHQIFAYFPTGIYDEGIDSLSINTENLLSLNLYQDEEIIISGSVEMGNKECAACLVYNNSFKRQASFVFQGFNRPITKFHYVGKPINAPNYSYLSSGFTPKYITGNSLDPVLSLNQLSVFVTRQLVY